MGSFLVEAVFVVLLKFMQPVTVVIISNINSLQYIVKLLIILTRSLSLQFMST